MLRPISYINNDNNQNLLFGSGYRPWPAPIIKLLSSLLPLTDHQLTTSKGRKRSWKLTSRRRKHENIPYLVTDRLDGCFCWQTQWKKPSEKYFCVVNSGERTVDTECCSRCLWLLDPSENKTVFPSKRREAREEEEYLRGKRAQGKAVCWDGDVLAEVLHRYTSGATFSLFLLLSPFTSPFVEPLISLASTLPSASSPSSLPGHLFSEKNTWAHPFGRSIVVFYFSSQKKKYWFFGGEVAIWHLKSELVSHLNQWVIPFIWYWCNKLWRGVEKVHRLKNLCIYFFFTIRFSYWKCS